MFTLRVWLLRVSGLSTLSSRRANSCPFKTAKKKQFFKIKRFDWWSNRRESRTTVKICQTKLYASYNILTYCKLISFWLIDLLLLFLCFWTDQTPLTCWWRQLNWFPLWPKSHSTGWVVSSPSRTSTVPLKSVINEEDYAKQFTKIGGCAEPSNISSYTLVLEIPGLLLVASDDERSFFLLNKN